jgi:hypothetical protein
MISGRSIYLTACQKTRIYCQPTVRNFWRLRDPEDYINGLRQLRRKRPMLTQLLRSQRRRKMMQALEVSA